jgi:NAD(P)H-flavin reductase
VPADLGARAGQIAAPDAFLPRPFRVTSVRRDTFDTVTIELDSVDGEGFVFASGQFTMLMAFGVGEVPISISGDPARPGRLVHTIRDVGGVTQSLCAARPGDVFGVRGPYGVGWAVSDGVGEDVVIVAGGIGLAPLRPAVLEVLAARQHFGRVSLLYGARTPDDVLFGAELELWAADADVDVAVTVDRAPTSWAGQVGLVTELIPRAAFNPARSLALVCGPEVMIRYVAAALAARGVPAGKIKLSLERNMRCGVGLCGHCQLREYLICVDGPVFPFDVVQPLLAVRQL